MSLKSQFRFLVLPVLPELTAIALIVVFCSRCTPMNASVDKADFSKESGAVSPVNSLPVPQKTDFLITKKILVDTDSGTRNIGSPLSGPSVKMSVSAKELARFKREGRADVQLDGVPSSDSVATLTVSAVNGGDSLADLSDFDLTLEKNSARGSWTIEISSDAMSRRGVQTMLAGLGQIALEFKAPAPAVTGTTGGTGSAANILEVYPATE